MLILYYVINLGNIIMTLSENIYSTKEIVFSLDIASAAAAQVLLDRKLRDLKRAFGNELIGREIYLLQGSYAGSREDKKSPAVATEREKEGKQDPLSYGITERGLTALLDGDDQIDIHGKLRKISWEKLREHNQKDGFVGKQFGNLGELSNGR